MKLETAVAGFFTVIIATLLAVLLVIYGAFAWAFVAKLFYSWFILPQFNFMPYLGIKAFAGIMFFLQALFPKYYPTQVKKEFKEESIGWYYIIVSPWVTLFFVWLLKIIIL